MDSEKTSVKEGEMEWKVKGSSHLSNVVSRVNNDLCSHFTAGLA